VGKGPHADPPISSRSIAFVPPKRGRSAQERPGAGHRLLTLARSGTQHPTSEWGFQVFFCVKIQEGREKAEPMKWRLLPKLPEGWPYAIEMRNSQWLRDDYFDCLARHGVTHVLNSWKTD
jgi:hypothetical protein